MKKILYSWLLAIAVCSCSQNTPVGPRPQVASEFVTGIEEDYGKYYDSVAHQVAALDLYSEGLTLDSLQRYQGSGTNLYISDIFLKDSLLEVGAYRSDTTLEAFTFLPGKNFEGNPTGIYVVQVEKGKAFAVTVYTEGTMEVKQVHDSTDITFHFPLQSAQKKEYTAHFRGILQHKERK